MAQHIVSFSGGKDSTAMLLMMIEKGMQIDKIISVDTTKEFPEMYDHIKKVNEYIKPLTIDVVKIEFDYYFGEHIKTRGKMKGRAGYGWPDFRNRWCTSLKRQAVKKLHSSDGIQYHGIAYDEKERANKNGDNIKYLLIEWQVTEKQALEYCYSRGFDWGGLYEKFHRVSCWCCPLSRIGELKPLYNDFPELWSDLEEMDKKSFRKFRSDYSVSDLTKRFMEEAQQDAEHKLF